MELRYFFTSKRFLFLVIFTLLFSVRFYLLYQANKSGSYTQKEIISGGDGADYLRIGRNIAKFHVYGDHNADYPTENATWRVPVWPFVLSIVFLFSENMLFIIVAKCLLETVLLFYIFYLFQQRSKLKAVELWPFLIIFLEPQYLKYSITYLSESFTALLILLLVVLFVFYERAKSYQITIPIVAALVVLCHPVASLFVLMLFGFYLLYNLRFGFAQPFLYGMLFLLIVLSWPTRNYLTFNKGFFMTASQGTTFSKGWNEKVATNFTNVDGDMADENMNLKYIGLKTLPRADSDILNESKLYSEGTWKFIESISLSEKVKIAWVKIKSNFNPLPEKPKKGILENLGTLFRIAYALLFLSLILRLFRGKIKPDSIKDRIYLVLISIVTGQIFISVYIYTGLRFNSIYGLALLFCLLYLSKDFFSGLKRKIYHS